MPKRGRKGGEKPAAKRARLIGQLAAAVDRSSGAMVSRRSRIMPPETKYFDTTFASTNTGGAADWTGTEVGCSSYIQSDGTTVGAYTDCALIPSAIGAGYGQVGGNKYFIKNLRVRGELAPSVLSDQADVTSARSVRLLLVHDTQPNGAQAQGEEVMTDLGGGNQCNYSFMAMGAGSGGRFRVLKDRLVHLQPALAGTDGANTNSISFHTAKFAFNYRPKKPIQVVLKANSSTPTVASLSNHNIFLLCHTSSATPTVTCVGAARCYYQD